MKADEAYLIGEPGHPVRAYLSVEEILGAAERAGADAIYPGYGFLSENPALASACERAGITFVGPSADVLELTGNKARAVAAAREAGRRRRGGAGHGGPAGGAPRGGRGPVLNSRPPSHAPGTLPGARGEIGFPLFVKAVAGGGGRGMRRVEKRKQLRESIEAAMR